MSTKPDTLIDALKSKDDSRKIQTISSVVWAEVDNVVDIFLLALSHEKSSEVRQTLLEKALLSDIENQHLWLRVALHDIAADIQIYAMDRMWHDKEQNALLISDLVYIVQNDENEDVVQQASDLLYQLSPDVFYVVSR